MDKNNIKLLYKSFDFKGKVSFLFNSLQSVFSDLFYGIIYFLIFEKLAKGKMELYTIFIIISFVFLYFIFLIPLLGYCMERCRNIYFKNLSNIVFEKIFSVNGTRHSSETIYLLQYDINQCSNMASWSLVVLFQSIFSGIISSFIIGKVSFKLLIVLYFLGIIQVCIDILFSRYIKNKYLLLRERVENFRKNITEYSNNIIVSNIYNISDEIENNLIESVYSFYKFELRIKLYDFLIDIINKIIYNFSFKLIVIVYGMNLVLKGTISFGYLALIISMIEGIIFFLSYIGVYIKNLQKMLISFQKLNKFLKLNNREKIKIFEEREVSKIIVENVFFGYTEEDIFINNMNMNLEFPNNYIVTGENGKGKSTLFRLIFGYLKPISGNIKIEYKETFKTSPLYVSQDTLIFDGSLYENLCLGNKFSFEDIKKALYCVGLDGWINDLEDTFNFKIENNGSNLSKGQKMRLTIAIALIRNPQILFLDEPDANLDKDTTITIFDRINKNYNCNLVVITHKKENFDCDDWKMLEI